MLHKVEVQHPMVLSLGPLSRVVSPSLEAILHDVTSLPGPEMIRLEKGSLPKLVQSECLFSELGKGQPLCGSRPSVLTMKR